MAKYEVVSMFFDDGRVKISDVRVVSDDARDENVSEFGCDKYRDVFSSYKKASVFRQEQLEELAEA